MSRVVGCFPNLDCALEEYFKQVVIHAVDGYRTETTLAEALWKIEKARKKVSIMASKEFIEPTKISDPKDQSDSTGLRTTDKLIDGKAAYGWIRMGTAYHLAEMLGISIEEVFWLMDKEQPETIPPLHEGLNSIGKFDILVENGEIVEGTYKGRLPVYPHKLDEERTVFVRIGSVPIDKLNEVIFK